MNRLTYKLKDPIVFDEVGIGYYNIKNMQEVHKSIEIANKLGALEDLMEKYHIESVEELESIIKTRNALAEAFGGKVYR